MEVTSLGDSSLLVRLAGTTLLVGANYGTVDVGQIDVVLLSNGIGSRHVPRLMMYERFTGLVYGTEPILYITRTTLEEAVALCPSSCDYIESDIESCLGDIHSVSYRQRIQIGSDLVAEPVPSGYSVGACNWILHTPFESIAIVMESSANYRRYPTPMDSAAISNCDMVIISPCARPTTTPEASQSLLNLCAIIELSLKQSGSVLIPVSPWALTFDLFDFLNSFLNAKAFSNVNMYWVSPAAPTAIAYWALVGEWLNEQKQSCLMEGKTPLNIDDLIARKRLQVFSYATNDNRFDEAFQEPAVVFSGLTNLQAGDITFFLQKYSNDPSCSLVQIEPDAQTDSASHSPFSIKTHQCPIDIRLSLNDYSLLLSQCTKCRLAVIPSEYESELNPAHTKTVLYHRDQAAFVDVKTGFHPVFIDAEFASSLPFSNNPMYFSGRLHVSDVVKLLPLETPPPPPRRLCGTLTINRLMTALHRNGYTDATVISTDCPNLSIEEALTVQIDIPSLEAQVSVRGDKTTMHCRDDTGRCAIGKIVQDLLKVI